VSADERDLHPSRRPRWRRAPAPPRTWIALALLSALSAGGCGRKPAPQLALDPTYTEEGIASYYDGEFVGRPTASGEIFAPDRLTAAHPSLPFGTVIMVTNLENGREAQVTVNDRGPFVKNRILDLSRAGADALGYVGAGTARVRLKVVQLPPPPGPVWLQLGAFREPEAAAELVRRLEDAGARPTVIEEEQYFKIRLGPFENPDRARPALERWRRQGLPGYLVQIK
jgi:rare lipoprotein A